jgi:hypothetical protein
MRVMQIAPARAIAAEPLQAVVDTPAAAASAIGRLTIQEQPLNAGLEQLGLAGSTVRMADIIEPAAALLSVLDALEQLGIRIDPVPPEAIAAIKSLSVRFDQRQPLQIRFAGGEIEIHVRAALALPPLIDLPVMPITLRYAVDELQSDGISLRPVGLKLEPEQPAGLTTGPIIAVLQSQATAALPAIRIPRRLEVPIPDNTPLRIEIDHLRSDGGRLSLAIK